MNDMVNARAMILSLYVQEYIWDNLAARDQLRVDTYALVPPNI